jgi:hypothetical protein
MSTTTSTACGTCAHCMGPAQSCILIPAEEAECHASDPHNRKHWKQWEPKAVTLASTPGRTCGACHYFEDSTSGLIICTLYCTPAEAHVAACSNWRAPRTGAVQMSCGNCARQRKDGSCGIGADKVSECIIYSRRKHWIPKTTSSESAPPPSTAAPQPDPCAPTPIEGHHARIKVDVGDHIVDPSVLQQIAERAEAQLRRDIFFCETCPFCPTCGKNRRLNFRRSPEYVSKHAEFYRITAEWVCDHEV